MANPSVTVQISAQDQASAAFQAVVQNLRAAAKQMEALTKSSGGNALSNINGMASAHMRAADAASVHHQRLTQINSALGTMTKAAVAYAVANVPAKAKAAIEHYIPVERTLTTIRATGGYSAAQIAELRAQHHEAANKYGERPEAVAHAQEAVARRGFDIPKTKLFTEESLKTAKAIGSDAREAAVALEGVIFGRGEHIRDKAHLKERLGYYGDRFAFGAKKGALDPRDLEEINKYGSAGLNAANVSYEKQMAMGMLLKRENFAGSDAGVFMRALSNALLKPTNDGRIALDAAGIRYENHVGPGKLSAENMNLTLERYLGNGVSPENIQRVQKSIESGAIKTAGDYSKAIVEAYESTHGKQSAQSRAKIAKQAQRAFTSSQGAVNGDTLLSEIFDKMTPAQAMQFLGVKQGTKAAAIISQLAQAREWEREMKDGTVDGYRDSVASARMQGLAAATDRLKSSVEATSNEFVEAWSGPLQGAANLGTAIAKWLGSLETADKQIMTATAGIVSAVATWKAMGWLKNFINPGAAPVATGPGVLGLGLEMLKDFGGFLAGNVKAIGGPLAGLAGATWMLEQDERMRARSRAFYAIPDDAWERSRRDTDRMRRDPEGARGEAWRKVVPVIPSEALDGGDRFREAIELGNNNVRGIQSAVGGTTEVKANVSGEVSGTGTLDIMQRIIVEPSTYFMQLIQDAKHSANIGLQGNLGTSMSGSNGVKPTGFASPLARQ